MNSIQENSKNYYGTVATNVCEIPFIVVGTTQSRKSFFIKLLHTLVDKPIPSSLKIGDSIVCNRKNFC